ncbi:MAG: Holliday junction branch migration protein RuvA [Bacteroidales bacterium]|nr:Holliday junction branch migration protein RuvA [Bacteroidales bacterium]
MYDYIKGILVELNPAEAVVEAGGVGYKILISLQTYSAIEQYSNHEVKLYVHHHLREDDEAFYGFADKDERTLFELLISVSGIGPGSARMMLSSLSSEELQNAIIGEDVNKIKSIKGIGVKTAQRVIIDLKDKIVTGSTARNIGSIMSGSSPVRAEAASALVLLGFSKQNVEKALDSVLSKSPDVSLEDLIKNSLKLL